jgi:galactonate dehydratase
MPTPFQLTFDRKAPPMKITDVKAYVVSPHEDYGLQDDWYWTFVQVDTDEGVSGYGEASNIPRGGSILTAHTVKALREALVGEDPADIERLWHKMYRRYTYLGGRGLPTTALSGIDIALWDIKGKALGRPVYDLLGGKVHDDVRLYDHFPPGVRTPEDHARAIREVTIARGHDAVKLDPFHDMMPYHTAYVTGQPTAETEHYGYEIVRAIREEVGPRFEILIDAHGHYNVPTAIRLANNLFDQSAIEWFEEPLPPESFEGLRQVRQHTRARICVGERLFTRYDFVPVFKDGLADYIMPDVVWTGGISELKKIATMAEAYYIPISPHNAQGSFQIVAGAHVMMTVPNFYRLEHGSSAIPDYNRFLTEPLNFHDGVLTLPDRPGLGYDLNMDEVMPRLAPGWEP